jgi:hypothetical protein
MLRRTQRYKYADATAMLTDFHGTAIDVLDRAGFSIVAAWTQTVATLGGTLTLEASNNYDPVHPGQAGEVWTTITGSNVTVSGSGTFGWNVADAYYSYVRLAWSHSAGDGTVTAWACVKD